MVEVFGSSERAYARHEYLAGVGGAMMMFAEYDYREGPALLQLSKSPLPPQTDAYASGTLTQIAVRACFHGAVD